ncbi:rRNA maturation RNase YbeY [Buchnera aphidicola]|uniref:Endoribonuclease YbeY n=1 Tax=Buchnera aphidicola (Anoecia oenotherae) TaxID=1241833 RepID=A0A4D6XVF3_9GAMM|nr:rRNA maturation RNase YbeY [Buchnera aphidicola]QCI19457.1 rRNA maturation RNase YbeY [Buchnera aphidicola (Anoecia oenotherae)]
MNKYSVKLDLFKNKDSRIPSKKHFKNLVQIISNIQKKSIFVSIKCVKKIEMIRLNKLYRNINKETNILAFPFKGPIVNQELKNFVGDLAICYETVIQEAIQGNKSILYHFSHIIIHGILHLIGFDHLNNSSAKKMESLERKILLILD